MSRVCCLRASVVSIVLLAALGVARGQSDPDAIWAGRITDEAGHPLPGARVVVVPDGGTLASMGVTLRRRAGFGSMVAHAPTFFGEIDLGALPTAETDASGAFQLRAPWGVRERSETPWFEGPYDSLLVVTRAGFASRTEYRREPPVEGRIDLGELPLEPEARVIGSVVDESGTPLMGVHVRVEQSQIEPEHLGKTYLSRSGAFPALDEVVTGADGRFEIHGQWAGRARVRCARDDRGLMRTQQVSLHSGEVHDIGRVVLPIGSDISGTVADAVGAPVPGATIFATKRENTWLSLIDAGRTAEPGDDVVGWQLLDGYDEDTPHATSDTSGRFTLRGVGDHAVFLYATAPRREPAKLRDVAPGSRDVRLVLPDEATLRVTVVDRSGQQLPGARLEARRLIVRDEEEVNYPEGTPIEVEAVGDGSFVVHGVGYVRTQLVATAPGYVKQDIRRPGLAAGGTGEQRIELVPAGQLGGRVVDAAGRPLRNASVRVCPDGRGWDIDAHWLTTNAEGRYVADCLEPGHYNIVVRREGYAPAAAAGLAVGTGAPLSTPDIVLPPPATLHLRTVDGGGHFWFDVKAQDPDDPVQVLLAGYVHYGWSERDGTCEVGGVPPGSFVLVPRGLKRVPVTVAAGETKTIDITLAEPCELHGHVSTGGAPIAGAEVKVKVREVHDGGCFPEKQVQTAADGGWSITLPGATYAEVVLVVGDDLADSPGAIAIRRFEWEKVSTDGLDVVLDMDLPTGEVHGTLVDGASGAPVVGQALQIGTADDYFGTAYIAADGGFSFPFLPDDEYQVAIESEDDDLPRTLCELAVARVVAGESAASLQLHCCPGATVAGRITTADGQPVDQPVFIFLLRAGESSPRSGLVPFRGEFKTVPLPAGSYKGWAGRKSESHAGPPHLATTIVLGGDAVVDVAVILAD